MRKVYANEVTYDFIDADVHICLVKLPGGLSMDLGGILSQKKDTIKGIPKNIIHGLRLVLPGRSSRDQ